MRSRSEYHSGTLPDPCWASTPSLVLLTFSFTRLGSHQKFLEVPFYLRPRFTRVMLGYRA